MWGRGLRVSMNSAPRDFLPDGIPDDPPVEPDPRVFDPPDDPT
jgi:hypothetical protein